jgi:hypothetical protein
VKIKEAIRLLQQQDPEAELFVYNHEFDECVEVKALVYDADYAGFAFREVVSPKTRSLHDTR